MSTNEPTSDSSKFHRALPVIYIALTLLLIGALLVRRPATPAPRPLPHDAGIDTNSTAPDFTLADAHDEKTPITLSRITAKQPVLLIYYLDYTCGRCVANLQAIADRKAELDALGIQVLAISPNTVTQTNDSIGIHGDFPFPLLSDADGRVAEAYDLKFGERLLHGCFLVDKDRQIRFAMASTHPYDNYEELFALCKMLHDNP